MIGAIKEKIAVLIKELNKMGDFLKIGISVIVVGFTANSIEVLNDLNGMEKNILNLVAFLIIGAIVFRIAQQRNARNAHVEALSGKALLDKESFPIFVGSYVKCEAPMPHLTQGKKYLVRGLLLNMDRVQILDDRGYHCDAQSKRFTVHFESRK